MGKERARTPKILVIGIGNADRGDDAAGLIAARRIRGQLSEECSVVEHTGEGAGLMELWKDADLVVAIDAMCSGARPGTITRFDATSRPLPTAAFRHSTHTFSLPEAIELSRALQQLPRQLIIYGIEAHNVKAGTHVAEAIKIAAAIVVERVLQELPRKQLCTQE